VRYKSFALALAALLCAPLTAHAIPITYQIKFTVLTGSVTTQIFPDPLEPGTPPATQVENASGRIYFGLFAVDDEILMSDGLGKPGNLDFFYIQMEDNIWGYNYPANNSLVGFRGPIPGDPFCLMTMACPGAPAPGFDVVDGTITNLRGGVFGRQDVPFVDFSPVGPNTFSAVGLPFPEPGTSFSYVGTGTTGVLGTMELFRVPEPSTLSLFGLALVALTLWARRTRKPEKI
jgi:hypothetical protein